MAKVVRVRPFDRPRRASPATPPLRLSAAMVDPAMRDQDVVLLRTVPVICFSSIDEWVAVGPAPASLIVLCQSGGTKATLSSRSRGCRSFRNGSIFVGSASSASSSIIGRAVYTAIEEKASNLTAR